VLVIALRRSFVSMLWMVGHWSGQDSLSGLEENLDPYVLERVAGRLPLPLHPWTDWLTASSSCAPLIFVSTSLLHRGCTHSLIASVPALHQSHLSSKIA
jgi:hypothetical protein